MRIAGIILLVVGILGTIYYGIQALNQSESFSLFGMEVAVSSANWTPLIISVLVLIIGIILTRTKGK
ncbi:MAG: hypothetical protein ACOC10_07955 [Bacteroidota bacterium]